MSAEINRFLRLRQGPLTRIWRALGSALPTVLASRLKSRVPPGIRQMTIYWEQEPITFDRLDSSTHFRAMFWSGEVCAEDDITQLFGVLSKDASVVFDIGSYIGHYAIIAAKANRHARIFSFEPLPEAVALQRHYLALNECRNVELLDLAIGDHVGEAQFFIPNRSASKIPNISSLKNLFRPGEPFGDRSGHSIPVLVATIDSIVDTHKLYRLDLVKIDVEEAEDAAIRGGIRSFTALRPDIIVEFTQGKRHAGDAFSQLTEIGYRAFSPEGLVEIKTFADFRPAHRLVRAAYGEVFFSFKSDAELARLRADIRKGAL